MCSVVRFASAALAAHAPNPRLRAPLMQRSLVCMVMTKARLTAQRRRDSMLREFGRERQLKPSSAYIMKAAKNVGDGLFMPENILIK